MDLFKDVGIQGVSAKSDYDNTDNWWSLSLMFHFTVIGNVDNYTVSDWLAESGKKPTATRSIETELQGAPR